MTGPLPAICFVPPSPQEKQGRVHSPGAFHHQSSGPGLRDLHPGGLDEILFVIVLRDAGVTRHLGGPFGEVRGLLGEPLGDDRREDAGLGQQD